MATYHGQSRGFLATYFMTEKSRFQISKEASKTAAISLEKPVTLSKASAVKQRNYNILLIGNSGVGKSTLINSIIGDEGGIEASPSSPSSPSNSLDLDSFDTDIIYAETGTGDTVTREISIYPIPSAPINLIDTVGLDYNFFSQQKMKKELSKYSKKSFSGNYIDMIWLCVDSMSGRLTEDTVKVVNSIAKLWSNVPVIVVLTKSYSGDEGEKEAVQNMVLRQLTKYGSKDLNIYKVIPVVAKEFKISSEYSVSAYNIEYLLEESLLKLKDSHEVTKRIIKSYALNTRKRKGNAIIAASVTSAAIVGAIPIPIADAAILVPLQTGMTASIAGIYGIDRKQNLSKKLIDTLVSCGTISVVAKGTLSTLKLILPGGGAVLNSIIAGAFTFALGEVVIQVMEQVYLGEKTIDDVTWVNMYATEQFSDKLKIIMPVIETTYKNLSQKANIGPKEIAKTLLGNLRGKTD